MSVCAEDPRMLLRHVTSPETIFNDDTTFLLSAFPLPLSFFFLHWDKQPNYHNARARHIRSLHNASNEHIAKVTKVTHVVVSGNSCDLQERENKGERERESPWWLIYIKNKILLKLNEHLSIFLSNYYTQALTYFSTTWDVHYRSCCWNKIMSSEIDTWEVHHYHVELRSV